jgi:hypothetical protein
MKLELIMTIKKVKMLFTNKVPQPDNKYYSSKRYRTKNKANSYLHASIMALFLAMILILLGYMLIDYDENHMYDVTPAINMILVPENTTNLNSF